jgi:hypothetical protein
MILGIAYAVAQFPMGDMSGNATASAPSIVQPYAEESDEGWLEAEFPLVNAQFSWIPPVANNASGVRYQYDFSIKRVVPGQEVVDAAEWGTVAFRQQGLMTSMCMIPQSVVETLKNSGTEYFVAQVIARPMSGNIEMINDGKSQIMLLHFVPETVQHETDSIDNK